MNKYLFVDLDDTLFSSLAKCDPGADLQPIAYRKDGSACSFTTCKQREFLATVSAGMTLIPATARSRDALSRVNVDFCDHKIIDHGGAILMPGGEPEPAWLEHMRGEIGACLPGLRKATVVIDDFARSVGFDARARMVEDFGIPFYVLVKDPGHVAARLDVLETQAVAPWIEGEGSGFQIYRNGNNLAVVPKALNKAGAVAYLIERLRAVHGEVMTVGMGDSRSDARFMAACDYAIVPNGSQLAALTLGLL